MQTLDLSESPALRDAFLEEVGLRWNGISDSVGQQKMSDQERLADVVEMIEVAEKDSAGEKVTVRELLAVFDDRSFGPLLFFLGMGQVALGMLPFVSDGVAIVVILITGQMVVNRKQPWLPGWLLGRELSKTTVTGMVDRIRPWAERGDRIFRRRCSLFVGDVARWAASLLACMMGVLMYFLGFIPIPGLVSVPALALVAFGVGLTVRDGLVMLLGFVVVLGSFGLGLWMLGRL